jgi:hypothetical protein
LGRGIQRAGNFEVQPQSMMRLVERGWVSGVLSVLHIVTQALLALPEVLIGPDMSLEQYSGCSG